MNNRYGMTASRLHWISALLIIAMIPVGKYMSGLALPADKDMLYRIHAAAGVLVLVLTLWRIVLAFRGPRPDPDTAWPAWMTLASRLAHLLLYLLLLVLAASGIATMVLSGLGQVLISGEIERWPDLAEIAPANAHGLFANILLALLVLHVVAALYHQFVLRDRIFERIAARQL